MAGILLGEWGFLNNLNDTSGNARHGTFVPGTSGGTLTYVTGPQASTQGIKFGSATNAVDFGRTGLEATADGVTTMGWIRIENGSVTGSAGSIVMGVLSKCRAASSDRHVLSANATSSTARVGNAFVRWKNDLAIVGTTGSWTGDGWHHVALVDGNTRWTAYVDGVQTNNGTRSFDNTSSPTWEDFPWLTGFNNNDASFIKADSFVSVSGLRIFQGELTTGEINSWMNTAITGGAAANTTNFFALL